jgi:DNA repair protein RadC
MIPLPWTDARVETLKTLWLSGLSAAQVAAALGGVSRNAVIGKLHRLGVAGRASASLPDSGAPSPPVRRLAPTSQQSARRRRARAQPSGPDLSAPAPSSPEGPPLAADLLSLGPHACRWPIGEPAAGGFGFCGRPAAGAGPYCAGHRARAYRGAGPALDGDPLPPAPWRPSVREIAVSPASGLREAPTSPSPSSAVGELAQRLLADGCADETDILALIVSRSACEDPRRPSDALLARFGGLHRVLGATLPELRQVAPESVAFEVRLFAETMQRVLELRFKPRPLLGSWSAVHDYLRARLAGRSREQFRVLFLDRANQLIADELMGEGTLDHAPVYPREVMRRALELAASACCLVHNHPSGCASPSSADVEMTRQVVAAGRAVGVVVHDHLLVAADVVVSFKSQGLM